MIATATQRQLHIVLDMFSQRWKGIKIEHLLNPLWRIIPALICSIESTQT